MADPGLSEQRRAQAVASLREVERRQAAGELDDDEAAELIAHFAERAEAATAELEAAGIRRTRGRERHLPVLVVAGVLALTVLVVAVSRLGGDDGDQARRGPVTNEEMEEVVAANPEVVGMRLALVERYLRDGDVRRAHDHAEEALRREPSAADRHRAEVYVGWTTALLGDPEAGARRLRAAVEEDPEDLNARWYLANVLSDLGDRDGAAAMLRSILDGDIPAAQREVVERKLNDVLA